MENVESVTEYCKDHLKDLIQDLKINNGFLKNLSKGTLTNQEFYRWLIQDWYFVWEESKLIAHLLEISPLKDYLFLIKLLNQIQEELQFLEQQLDSFYQFTQREKKQHESNQPSISIPPPEFIDMTLSFPLSGISFSNAFLTFFKRMKSMRDEGHLILTSLIEHDSSKTTMSSSSLKKGEELLIHYSRILLWIWATEKAFFEAWSSISNQVFDPKYHLFTSRWTNSNYENHLKDLTKKTDIAFTEWVSMIGNENRKSALVDALNITRIAMSQENEMWKSMLVASGSKFEGSSATTPSAANVSASSIIDATKSTTSPQSENEAIRIGIAHAM